MRGLCVYLITISVFIGERFGCEVGAAEGIARKSLGIIGLHGKCSREYLVAFFLDDDRGIPVTRTL